MSASSSFRFNFVRYLVRNPPRSLRREFTPTEVRIHNSSVRPNYSWDTPTSGQPTAAALSAMLPWRLLRRRDDSTCVLQI